MADRRFAGSTLDWLTPFNLFCGLGLVVAYLLLGTTWLIMKSEGALQQRMRELTRKVLLALMAVIAVVSVWTPLGWRYVAERWFTLPNFFWFVPVPILVLALSLWIWRLSARPASHARPFILTLGLIFLGFSGLGISVWPNIIPPHISLWDAAAPSSGIYAAGRAAHYPGDPDVYRPSYYVFAAKSPAARAITEPDSRRQVRICRRVAPSGQDDREGCAQTGDLLQRLGPGVYAFGGLILIINRSLTRVILAPISPNSVAILKIVRGDIKIELNLRVLSCRQ